MRIWVHRIMAMILMVSLLTTSGPVFASQTTETAAQLPTEATTGPAETEPAATEPEAHTYTVDTESAMYQVCDAVADGMNFDQLLVYDATNDEILYTNSREGSKLYPASVTKLFSAYVALQYLDPEEIITAGDEMDLVHPGSSVAYISKGDQLYVKSVVEGMMLPSGNDAAIMLAAAAGRRIAEDEELEPEEAIQTFVREMNRKARELGFERTHFSNPDGWHSGSHYTCLNDMARIAKLALENKIISRYIRLFEDKVYFPSGQLATWENTNELLNPEERFYRSDAIGMKTGYTRQAEYCLMSAFRCSDGRILVIGVFGYADKDLRFEEASRLATVCKEQLKLDAKNKK